MCNNLSLDGEHQKIQNNNITIYQNWYNIIYVFKVWYSFQSNIDIILVRFDKSEESIYNEFFMTASIKL